MSDCINTRANIKKIKTMFFDQESFITHKKVGSMSISNFTKFYIIQKYNLQPDENYTKYLHVPSTKQSSKVS